MWRVIVSALILLPTLTACASLTNTAAIKGHASFCDVAKPISFSRLRDTAETIAAIKEHNAVHDELCAKP
jgi:hypothetical protein